MSEWEIPQYRPGQKIKLTDLSNDILTVLAECISEQKFASTQYRLSECTPYLKQIAAPFVSLSYSDKETRWPLSNNKQLQEFLRKVLAQPDYARRIKKYEGYVIRFRDEYTGIEDGALDVSMFTEVDWKRIRTAIAELEPDGVRTTLWDIERGSWEAMTTLALSRLPFLEELAFQGWHSYDDIVPSMMAYVANAAKRQKEVNGPLLPFSVPLAHLSKVSIAHWDTEGGMYLDQLEAFMPLKSVQSICGHMVHGEFYNDPNHPILNFNPEDDLDNDGPPTRGGDSFPNILEVDFNYSSIDYRVIETFLSECPNVQKFRYDDSGMVEGGTTFFPPRFMHALRQLEASLEELIIEPTENWGMSHIESYPLGSFDAFPKLKTIKVDAGHLIGSVNPEDAPHIHSDEFNDDESVDDRFPMSLSLLDALPPNLERLTMNCNVSVVEALHELLGNIEEFPSLKHINLGWFRIVYPDKPLARLPSLHPGFTVEEVVTLLDQCDAAGVTMEMARAPPPYKILYGYIRDAKPKEIPALIAAGGDIFTTLAVEYPYTEWEKLCEQFQCDVETGRRVGPGGLL